MGNWAITPHTLQADVGSEVCLRHFICYLHGLTL
jgi:hypothetical protein